MQLRSACVAVLDRAHDVAFDREEVGQDLADDPLVVDDQDARVVGVEGVRQRLGSGFGRQLLRDGLADGIVVDRGSSSVGYSGNFQCSRGVGR